jgi:hypothetical protein
MAIDPKEFAQAIGAEVVGEVPDVGGGPFGMARLANIMCERNDLRILWDRLSKAEQMVFLGLHASGASPRKAPLKADKILIEALHQSGQWSNELETLLRTKYFEDWPILLQDLDRALVDMVNGTREGRQVIEGWFGNWALPCHPSFRECRLSMTGQQLVLEARGIQPETINDDVLGELPWNSAECCWERKFRLPSGNIILLSVYQDVPGASLNLEPARRTLTHIRIGEQRIRQMSAAGATKADSRMLLGSKELPPITTEELSLRLIPTSILLHPAGGALITCQADRWNNYRIEVEVSIEGLIEDVVISE